MSESPFPGVVRGIAGIQTEALARRLRHYDRQEQETPAPPAKGPFA